MRETKIEKMRALGFACYSDAREWVQDNMSGDEVHQFFEADTEQDAVDLANRWSAAKTEPLCHEGKETEGFKTYLDALDWVNENEDQNEIDYFNGLPTNEGINTANMWAFGTQFAVNPTKVVF